MDTYEAVVKDCRHALTRRSAVARAALWLFALSVSVAAGSFLVAWFPNTEGTRGRWVFAEYLAGAALITTTAVWKLSERRFPDAVPYFGVMFVSVGLVAVAASEHDAPLLYFGGSALLLSGILTFVVYSFWLSPTRVLHRRLRRQHLPEYVSMRFVDAAIQWPGKHPYGSHALADCAQLLQYEVAQRRRTGKRLIDRETRDECWKIASYVISLGRKQTLPSGASPRDYEDEIAAILSHLRARNWGDLPRVEESPSWFDRNRGIIAPLGVACGAVAVNAAGTVFVTASKQARDVFFRNLGSTPWLVFLVAVLSFSVAFWAALKQRR